MAGNSLAVWATARFSRTIVIVGVTFIFTHTWIFICPLHHWFNHGKYLAGYMEPCQCRPPEIFHWPSWILAELLIWDSISCLPAPITGVTACIGYINIRNLFILPTVSIYVFRNLNTSKAQTRHTFTTVTTALLLSVQKLCPGETVVTLQGSAIKPQ
jgi:hypothetical protein